MKEYLEKVVKESKVRFGTYYDGSIGFELIDEKTGEINACPTVNLELGVKHPYVLIKDYSENEGIIDSLINNEVVEKEILDEITINDFGSKVKLVKLTEKYIKQMEEELKDK